MDQNYNIKNIRDLLKKGFTPEDLLELTYDEPPFRPVYDEFSTSPGKGQIVQRLIEYAERQSLLDHLLDCAKERNQACYDQYQPYTASPANSPLPPAFRQAVTALNSPIQTERLNAVESLAALVAKYPQAQDNLAEAVQNAAYPDVRVHGAFMLVQFKDVRAVPGLVEALHDRSSTVSLNTLPKLFKFGDINRYSNFLYTSDLPLDAEVFPRCYVAIFALGQIQNVIAAQELVEALKDEDTLMRRFAALSMKFLGDPKIIPILCKALKDEEWLVREAVAWTLGRIGDNKIIADLTALLSDESYEVRNSAIDALKHIGTPEALEAIDLWREARVDSIIQGW